MGLFGKSKEERILIKADKLTEMAEQEDLNIEKKLALIAEITEHLINIDNEVLEHEIELDEDLIEKINDLNQTIKRLSEEIDEEMKDSQKRIERAVKRLEKIKYP